MDVRAYDKLMAMTAEKREKSFQTKKMIIHEERVKQKMERVNEVRELKRIGLSNREISRRTGLNRKTVSRYLDENFNPVHAAYGKKLWVHILRKRYAKWDMRVHHNCAGLYNRLEEAEKKILR